MGTKGGLNMNILSDLNALLSGLGFDVATAVYKDEPPDEYVVITPTQDRFLGHADNKPRFESQGAEISLFTRGSYVDRKDIIVGALMRDRYKIPLRLYQGIDNDAGLHHYVIGVVKAYGLGAYGA